jgi:hypothetical protein
VTLQVRPLRFEFRALDPISFPPGKAANIFRGAFGEIFSRTANSQQAYARMFEPRGLPGAPSGFADLPRPFVLRAASLNGQRFEPGQRFTLEVNIFDPTVPALDYFRESFIQLREEGLGPGRPRVDLIDAAERPTVEVDLAPRIEPTGNLRVEFLTPTELKSGGEILREPAFDVLFKRARDRIAGLIGFYQPASLIATPIAPPDFRAMGERAAAIRMTHSRIEQHDYERRSSRTGQRHSLGGFIGEADYEGDLTEFVPYLEATWWTGVGRLTVWGNGQLCVSK